MTNPMTDGAERGTERIPTPRTDAAILTDPYEVKMLPFEVVRAYSMECVETDLTEAIKVAGEAETALMAAQDQLRMEGYHKDSSLMSEIGLALAALERIRNNKH